MALVVVDLANLEPADLTAVRLGAQIMGHKAAVVARPRVEGFFAALAVAVGVERARLDGAAQARAGSVVLPYEERDRAGDAREDRRLLVEYLDLLTTNPRLSPGVRGLYEAIRLQLAASSAEEWRETTQ